jgi:hypothetical protein
MMAFKVFIDGNAVEVAKLSGAKQAHNKMKKRNLLHSKFEKRSFALRLEGGSSFCFWRIVPIPDPISNF